MKKFFAVIGNPPYQDESSGEQKNFAPPIYNSFMDEAYKVAEKVTLVTPARFLFNAGSTPKKWNEKMLADKHLKVLKYVADGSTIFPNTDIKGGVAVTYRDESKDYGAIGTFTAFEELNGILKKVCNSDDFKSFSDVVFSRTEYRFNDKMHHDHPEAKTQQSRGHLYDVSTNIFDILPQIFFEKQPDDKYEYIQIFGLNGRDRLYKYVRRDYINPVKNLDYYKIFVPKANGSGALGEVLSTPLIGQPLIGHTETFISIGVFKTKKEADACLKYVKGKFSRAMLGILKATQDNPPAVWKYVPLQDFTSKSDIDWTKSVHEIDLQLYKKYSLSKEEKDFIETHVKEMV